MAERLPLAIFEAGAELTAEAQNISASGVYCTVDRFIAPMSKLQLTFELSNGARRSRIRCQGVVVRVEPAAADLQRERYHIAIFFTDVADQDRAAIAQFVNRRLARS